MHVPECGRYAALGKAPGSVRLLDERIRIVKDTDGVGTRLRISIGCIERQDGLAHGLIIALEPHPDIREYMPGLASARPPAPPVEILDLIDAFAPEALISVAAGGRKKPRNPMPVPMVAQPCKISVQVQSPGPGRPPWEWQHPANSSL